MGQFGLHCLIKLIIRIKFQVSLAFAFQNITRDTLLTVSVQCTSQDSWNIQKMNQRLIKLFKELK